MHRNDFLPRYRIPFLVSQIESNEDRYTDRQIVWKKSFVSKNYGTPQKSVTNFKIEIHCFV